MTQLIDNTLLQNHLYLHVMLPLWAVQWPTYGSSSHVCVFKTSWMPESETGAKLLSLVPCFHLSKGHFHMHILLSHEVSKTSHPLFTSRLPLPISLECAFLEWDSSALFILWAYHCHQHLYYCHCHHHHCCHTYHLLNAYYVLSTQHRSHPYNKL